MAERSVHDGDVLHVVAELRVDVRPERIPAGRRRGARIAAARIARCPTRAPQYFAGDPRNANRARDPFLAGRLVQSRQPDLLQRRPDARQRRSSSTRSAATAIGAARRPGMWRRAERRSHRARRSIPTDFCRSSSRTSTTARSRSASRATRAAGSGISAPSTAATRSTFTIDNSANVSLGNASKTSFDAGELDVRSIDDDARSLPRSANAVASAASRRARRASFAPTSTRSPPAIRIRIATAA